jgi:hypothetical protein
VLGSWITFQGLGAGDARQGADHTCFTVSAGTFWQPSAARRLESLMAASSVGAKNVNGDAGRSIICTAMLHIGTLSGHRSSLYGLFRYQVAYRYLLVKLWAKS